MRSSRRVFLATSLTPLWLGKLQAAPDLRVRSFELIPVRATMRTVWLIVRLRTDQGLSGLGEASDAFGFLNTTKQDALMMESKLHRFFSFAEGKSPLDVEAYRQKAEPVARAGGWLHACGAAHTAGPISPYRWRWGTQ